MHHKCIYFPPKTQIITPPPPFLLPLTNPLCMVVCQLPLVGSGEHYFLIKYGGKYQHPWCALGCSTLKTGQTTLPYHEPGHKKHNTHKTTNMSGTALPTSGFGPLAPWVGQRHHQLMAPPHFPVRGSNRIWYYPHTYTT